MPLPAARAGDAASAAASTAPVNSDFIDFSLGLATKTLTTYALPPAWDLLLRAKNLLFNAKIETWRNR
jgi:hypothetical protein